MAIRNISGCTSAQTYTVDFVDFPIIGDNVYYLTFSCPACSPGEEPPAGCYTVLSSGDSSSISVVSVDSFANSCPDCVAANPTPTPTPTVTNTQTPTPTQTNTGTPAVTPSVTATKTPTPTPTPSVTTTNTPTPTLTPTPSLSGFALSAGTEYFECRWCPDETPTAEAVPHAVYSNAQGRSVIQQNSVALGGFNGLNS
jgi:hypothetical protein